ncbi:MaoC family dehydratase [Pseudooceanicola sediminis]|uniref:MaoC family dehydratase n=1 Tax=Pseudooceanicola sediminis TaxID=2211117 RepID=A0A399J0W4_9RHOB|nr:MaoC family dehydratase [Pseudooceanicola sediminis]KAA2316059.1 MaoC family dehydratase [Puniceibacterium sp. HSS470]RII38169.1 MaoC family dehydratase [Pseudooceanicola sediminis]|tara:strand:- start:10320 stop:10766 length:447 start_codon:yes stop_codon:yes gene_type:complete
MTDLYLEDMAAGQTYASSGRVKVTQDAIVAFAETFDPQPFHTDAVAAKETFFQGLAASGWHTAALTMQLTVASDFRPAGGIIGAGFDELRWPRPVRPGDELHLEMEILEVRELRTRPGLGMIKVRTVTLNQNDDPVQISVGNLTVLRR